MNSCNRLSRTWSPSEKHIQCSFPSRVEYHCVIEGWGEAQPGNRFGSVVRAYARSGSEVGIGENRAAPSPFPFPFCPFIWYFVRVCVVLVNPGEI